MRSNTLSSGEGETPNNSLPHMRDMPQHFTVGCLHPDIYRQDLNTNFFLFTKPLIHFQFPTF